MLELAYPKFLQAWMRIRRLTSQHSTYPGLFSRPRWELERARSIPICYSSCYLERTRQLQVTRRKNRGLPKNPDFLETTRINQKTTQMRWKASRFRQIQINPVDQNNPDKERQELDKFRNNSDWSRTTEWSASRTRQVQKQPSWSKQPRWRASRTRQVQKQLGLIKNNPDEVHQGSCIFRNNSDQHTNNSTLRR
jgi:hypothetical protein